MSKLEAIDLNMLRARLDHALRLDVAHDGSVYLLAVACVFLACDEDSPGELGMLESIFYQQAQAEAIDGDQLLTTLCLVEVLS
jgi:hypothetical protein